ncbi:hypothetical protein IWZ01DRAFT_548039 [Phyllosticta capitalensis]
MSQRQQPQHQHPLPVEASRLRDGISSAVHAARAASSRSIPTPVPSAPRPRPANDAGPASFSQRHAEFRSFTPQQQNQKQQRRPAPGSNSSNSLKKLVAGLKEIHRAAPENDTAVLSREVREWYRERKEAKRDDVATQVRAYVKLQQREEEEVQRLLRMQEEQYRWRQEQLLQQQQQVLVKQQQREEEQEREAQVMPTIEVTSAPEEDWRSGKGSESPPEQFYDFVVRERATEGQTRMPPGTGAIVPAATVRHHEVHEEPLPQVQAYHQGGFVNQPPEHRPPINRAAPRAGRLLYASERMCYGPNEPLPTRPSQPDDLEVLVSKLQDFKADIMEGRQRHKAAKAARRLASQQSKQNEAREKWRQEMKGRIGGPRLLVAGEEQRGISAGVRQSLDEISPVRSPISPLRRHSIASPVVLTRPAAPPGRIHVPQVLPSPLESRKSSPPAFYSHAHNASRVTQWDDFVNPRATPPPPVVPAPPGTAASSSSVALTAASTRGILSSSSTVSLSTSPAPVSSKPPFSISTSTPKSALSSLHFKPTLPKLFTRGIAALPKHHHHHVSTTSSGASSSFGCRGISAGAEAKGVAAMMMMRAARAASVASSQQGEGAGRDAPFRSPFAPIRHVSPLAVEFGEQRKRRASYSSSVSSLGSVEEADAAARRYSVMAAVPSPLNVRKTVTPLTATAKAPPYQNISVGLRVAAGSEEQQQQRYDSRLSASSSSSSNYNQETTRGIRSRSRSAGASSTFSRPSWWTWESPSPSPISSSRQPTHRHRGMQPSLPNLLVSDVDAKTASHQRPYPESDSDAESLYKAPPPPLPRRVATPAPAEPYVPPRQNWTATSTTTANASASSFSSGNGSSSSGSSGSGMRNTAVKEKTRFWDEVRNGLRPSNASFVRSVVGQQQQRNRGRDDGR